MSIPHHLLQSKAGSQQCTTKGGQFWTPIPRLRGSNLHAETHYVTGAAAGEFQANGVQDSVILGKPFPLNQLVEVVERLVSA
jgi:hypothetical protein